MRGKNEMNVLLATKKCYEINQQIHACYYLKNAEEIWDILSHKKIDVIVMQETFLEYVSWREYILKLRTRFPDVRIIFILEKENNDNRTFLYHWMVFDVVIEKECTAKTLHYRLKRPKTFSQISLSWASPSEEEIEKWKKNEHTYAFLINHSSFVIKEMSQRIVSYYFEETDFEIEVSIPFGNNVWEKEIKIEETGNVPETLKKEIEKARIIFEKQQRIRKIVNGRK